MNNEKDLIPLCDPHFHLWDLSTRPNSNLGKAGIYVASDYQNDLRNLPENLHRVSGVHIETVVGQMPGGETVNSFEETEWVYKQLTQLNDPFGIVAYVHLARQADEIKRDLDKHVQLAEGHLRGIRMILNYHPTNSSLTWPQVEHDRFSKDSRFQQGLSILAEQNLSFDLSCHPHQVADIIPALSAVADLRIIVNHLGFLHDSEEVQHENLWRKSMRSLAEQPNVFMKLSMLWFTRKNFTRDHEETNYVRERVLETIDIFGQNRCMFASNYPVDRSHGIDISTLYKLFLEWTDDFSFHERRALFHDTALFAYGGTL